MDNRRELINELLTFQNIEGLLSIGAPGDEYESEAEMIANRISEAEHKRSDGKVAKEEVAS
jgi:hypothetical protein